MNKKKLVLNTFAQLLNFFSTILIGLIITPHIVAKLGSSAYGYISIANDFAGYVTILTSALNSMAGRFISMELHKGDKKRASILFNSVFVADFILGIVALVFGALITLNINHLLNISPELVTDVKITFTLVFLNLVINLIMSVFSVAPFVTDNLQKSAVRGVFSNLIKVLLLILLFTLLPAKIYYVTISIMGTSIFLIITNLLLTHKLLPDMRINIREFEFKAIAKLISSGIWNSINQLSNMLLTGLSGIITNIFVGEAEMGILSIARTIPLNFATMISTFAAMFTPHFVILYAKGEIKALLKEAKYTLKLLPFMMIVPIAGYLAFGSSFFKLWMWSRTPEEWKMMQILSVFSMGTNLMSIFVYPLTSINTTTNKLKWPVITTFITGVLSITTVLITVNVTNIGVYAVNFISTAYSMARLFFFVPMYSAHNLKMKLTTFYPIILRGLGTFFAVLLLFIGIHTACAEFINSWLRLIILALICGPIGYGVVFLLIFNKEEKRKFLDLVARKLKRK